MRSLENRCENRCNFDTLSKYVSRNIYLVSSKNFFPPVVKKRKKKKTGRFENGGKERKGSGKSCKKEDGRDNMAAFPCIWSELGGRDSASNLINKLKKKKKKNSFIFVPHAHLTSLLCSYLFLFLHERGGGGTREIRDRSFPPLFPLDVYSI